MKPSIEPDINRINKLVEKKINECKEKLPYEAGGERVLTEFGAMKILKEVPFTLLSQYIKLFDHYKIRKSDLLLLLKNIDGQADLVKNVTNSKNVEFSGAMDSETGELVYDEWYGKDYGFSVQEFDKSIALIKERIKASYETNEIRTKEFWVPVSISIAALGVSLVVGLLNIFL